VAESAIRRLADHVTNRPADLAWTWNMIATLDAMDIASGAFSEQEDTLFATRSATCVTCDFEVLLRIS
jgi:hypothetical protein